MFWYAILNNQYIYETIFGISHELPWRFVWHHIGMLETAFMVSTQWSIFTHNNVLLPEILGDGIPLLSNLFAARLVAESWFRTDAMWWSFREDSFRLETNQRCWDRRVEKPLTLVDMPTCCVLAMWELKIQFQRSRLVISTCRKKEK